MTESDEGLDTATHCSPPLTVFAQEFLKELARLTDGVLLPRPVSSPSLSQVVLPKPFVLLIPSQPLLPGGLN